MPLTSRALERVRRIPGRLKSEFYRRLPSLQSTVSIERSRDAATLVDLSAEIIPAFTVSCIQADATPAAISFRYATRYARLFRDVTFWPAWGVAEVGGALIEETAFSDVRIGRLLETGSVKKTPAKSMDGIYTTLHAGLAWHNHYHWLIDSLPRIYALHHPAVRELGRVTVLVARKFTSDESRLLAALLPDSVDVREISARARVRPSGFLFLPFLSGDCNGYLPTAYIRWLQQRAFPAFGVIPSSTPERRVFMSRENAPKRNLLNETELRETLRPLGFESYRLDELSLAEQMQLFCDAQFAVGQHGAAFANLTFMRSGAVVEICSGNDPWHFRYLAASMGLRYGHVVEADAPRNGSYAVSPGAVRDRVISMLEHSGTRSG